jgi:hypothetical protein
MIRFGLLGGRWGPIPWELFVTLGGSCLGAAALFVWLESPWLPGSWYRLVGWVPLTVAGLALVAVGAGRRSRSRGSR